MVEMDEKYCYLSAIGSELCREIDKFLHTLGEARQEPCFSKHISVHLYAQMTVNRRRSRQKTLCFDDS